MDKNSRFNTSSLDKLFSQLLKIMNLEIRHTGASQEGVSGARDLPVP